MKEKEAARKMSTFTEHDGSDAQSTLHVSRRDRLVTGGHDSLVITGVFLLAVLLSGAIHEERRFS